MRILLQKINGSLTRCNPIAYTGRKNRSSERAYMAAPLNTDIKTIILQSAEQLLQNTSFDEISLSAIARQAGISKGTLYYYYNSKDDILFDITDRYLTRLADSLLQWTGDTSKDTSFKRLVRYVLREGVHDKSGNLRMYLCAEAAGGDEAVRRKLLEKYRQFGDMLTEKIKERRPQTDAAFTAWLLLVLMDGLLVQNRLDNPGIDVDAFIERLVLVLEQWQPGGSGK